MFTYRYCTLADLYDRDEYKPHNARIELFELAMLNRPSIMEIASD